MPRDLLDNLELFAATGSPGNFFSEQALSYHLFFKEPSKRKEIVDEDRNNKRGRFQQQQPNSAPPAGCIVNTTGRTLVFPKGLSTRYCKDFFDVGRECKYGKSCNFAHKLFPMQTDPQDKAILLQWINDTPGLTLTNKAKGLVDKDPMLRQDAPTSHPPASAPNNPVSGSQG